jgi:hypothetical protein
MRKNRPAARAIARPRFQSIVTTMLLIALSVLIVRDIIIRRWSSAAPPSSGVTRRLP